MQYHIQGRNLEMLRVELESETDGIVSEVGKMIYKSPQIRWRMAMPGEGIAGKLAGTFRRRMSGESAFQCHFTGPGEIGFGAAIPPSPSRPTRPSSCSAAASSPPNPALRLRLRRSGN